MNTITNNNLNCSIALASLHTVEDPEIGLNVVDLGLIYQLDFDEVSKLIFCTMTLTTQFCPMGEAITNGVKTALENTFGDFVVEVTLSFDPPWSHEMISEEGQEFLNQ